MTWVCKIRIGPRLTRAVLVCHDVRCHWLVRTSCVGMAVHVIPTKSVLSFGYVIVRHGLLLSWV